MWMFLAKDIVGGITGPVNSKFDLGAWLDEKNIDVLIAFAIGILLGIYIHYRISKRIQKKDKQNNDKNQE